MQTDFHHELLGSGSDDLRRARKWEGGRDERCRVPPGIGERVGTSVNLSLPHGA